MQNVNFFLFLLLRCYWKCIIFTSLNRLLTWAPERHKRKKKLKVQKIYICLIQLSLFFLFAVTNKQKEFNPSGLKMNSNYNSAGFHMKGPSVAVEPLMGPLNESPMQGVNFVSNRDQYGFQTHGHGDMLAMGVQPQHQLHMQGPFNHQPPNHDQHSHLYQDSVPSCLHGDRHMGFNNNNAGHPHMFEGGSVSSLQRRSRENASRSSSSREWPQCLNFNRMAIRTVTTPFQRRVFH